MNMNINNTIDRASIFILSTLGTLFFVVFSLDLTIFQNVFTLLGVSGPFPHSLENSIGGAFAAGIAMINLQAVLQNFDETSGTKASRQFANFATFMGLICTHLVCYNRNDCGACKNHPLLWITVLFITLFVGNGCLVYMSDPSSIHSIIHNNFFSGFPESKMDAILSTLLIIYGTLCFLAIGLHFEMLQGITTSFMNLFGLLGATVGPLGYDNIGVLGGGAFAWGLAGLNLSAFTYPLESRNVRDLRLFGNLTFFICMPIAFIVLGHVTKVSIFYYFWIFFGSFAAVATFMLGSDLLLALNPCYNCSASPRYYEAPTTPLSSNHIDHV